MNLDIGELAANVERLVGDVHLTVVIHPALTPENVVNARRCFVPAVLFTESKTSEMKNILKMHFF